MSRPGVRLLGVFGVLLWTAAAVPAQTATAGRGSTGGPGASGGASTSGAQVSGQGAAPAGAAVPGASTGGSFTLPTGPTGVLGSPTPVPAASIPANAPVIGVSVNGSNVTSGETVTVPATPVADTSDALVVTITNTGGTTLELDKYAPPELYGNAAMMYLIDYSTYADTVDPGESTSISLTFFPYETGTDDATLVIISNDPRTPQFEVNLAGTGLPMSDSSSQPYGGQ